MKASPYLLAIILLITILYLGFNNFEFPTYFWFSKTEKTKGEVTKVLPKHLGKGFYLQAVTYKYQVKDSLYKSTFNAGQSQGRQKVGDKILIEYSVSTPQKSKVVGYYRN